MIKISDANPRFKKKKQKKKKKKNKKQEFQFISYPCTSLGEELWHFLFLH